MGTYLNEEDQTFSKVITVNNLGDYDPSLDHNAGSMVRGVIAIRVNPIPDGYEDFDYISHNRMNTIANVAVTSIRDVVVANAGIGLDAPFATMSDEALRDVFEVNVFGTMQITQAVIPSMKARGTGRIITVSSIAGLIIALGYLTLELAAIAAAVHAVMHVRTAQGSTAWVLALVGASKLTTPGPLSAVHSSERPPGMPSRLSASAANCLILRSLCPIMFKT